jgi:hypothetical protein
MNTDPPDFADACRLLFTIQIGGAEFPADVPALDAWMAAQALPDETLATYYEARQEAVDAFIANDGSATLRRRLQELHRIVHLLRAQPLARRGAPFTEHNGRGESQVKKLVREVLPKLEKKLQRNASSLEVWKACAARPRTGIQFTVHPTWGSPKSAIPTRGKPASWPRFQVIISEVRRSRLKR